MQKTIIGMALGVALVAAGVADAAQSAPVRSKVAAVVTAEMQVTLKGALKQYNETRKKGFEGALKALGMKPAILNALRKELPGEGKLLKAEWREGEIQIRDSGVVIAIGPSEMLEHKIRVNDLTFQWSMKKSLTENVREYHKFFTAAAGGVSQWSPMDLLLPKAYARWDLFYLEASGISLYFSIDDVGQKGSELKRLEAKVDREIKSCNSKKADVDFVMDNQIEEVIYRQKDIFDTMGSGASASMPLTCDSLKAYAKTRSKVIKYAYMDEESHMPVESIEYVEVEFPKDLCAKIKTLDECFSKRAVGLRKQFDAQDAKDAAAVEHHGKPAAKPKPKKSEVQ